MEEKEMVTLKSKIHTLCTLLTMLGVLHMVWIRWSGDYSTPLCGWSCIVLFIILLGLWWRNND
jgi:hypothetical protein